MTSVGLPNENKPYLKNGTVQAVALWDPKDAGYAHLLAMAVAVLKGEKVANGLNLGVKGYEQMSSHPAPRRFSRAQGWITINKKNVDTFGF